MPGRGFFSGDDVAGEHREAARRWRSPTACSSTAATDASAEVEATASVHPASSASPMIRAMPGRAGQRRPRHHLRVDRGLALVPVARCSSFCASGVARRSPLARDELVASAALAIRSLPPPIFSFSRVLLVRPLDGQAELGERLVERGQVAVALGVGEHAVAVEDQRRHRQRPTLQRPAVRRCRRCRCASSAICLTAARARGSSSVGGSCLSGLRLEVVAVRAR